MSDATTNYDHERFLSSRMVRRRYGDISTMSLHRWLGDEDMGFPKPTYMGRLRFWKLAELIEWENRQNHAPDPARCIIPKRKKPNKVSRRDDTASEVM